jgi:hypothetical protein
MDRCKDRDAGAEDDGGIGTGDGFVVADFRFTSYWWSMYISPYYAICDSQDETDKEFNVFNYDQIMICDTISVRVFVLWFNFMLPESTPGKIPEFVLMDFYRFFMQL